MSKALRKSKSKSLRVFRPSNVSGGPAINERADVMRGLTDAIPNYKYPIIFYIVTHELLEEIVQNADRGRGGNLNTYINVQIQKCFAPSAMDPSRPFLSNSNEVCFLFMRWDARHHLETLYSNADKSDFYECINDYEFLNKKLLGHTRIVHQQRHVNYLAIYDVCKHQNSVLPDGSVQPRDPGKIGIDMFSALLTGMTFQYSTLSVAEQESTIMWLGIDVKNPDFDKVAYIYTIHGFSNPTISNRDYMGTNIGIVALQLTRPLLAHANSYLKTTSNFNQVMNLKKGAAGRAHLTLTYSNVTSQIMTYRFSFDRSCITTLHMFPYLSFNTTKGAVGLHAVAAQRETGGKFVVASSEVGHDILVLDTVEVSSTHRLISYSVGTSSEVDIPCDEATFHTHPMTNYFMNRVKIGPPSGGDFNFYAYTFARLQLEGNKSFKFSLVSTIEGVYIISLQQNGIRKYFDSMTRFIGLALAAGAGSASAIDWSSYKTDTDDYEYPFMQRAHDMELSLETDEAASEEAMKTSIGEYMKWFEHMNTSKGNLFNVTFVPWDKFSSSDIHEVLYLENLVKLYP